MSMTAEVTTPRPSATPPAARLALTFDAERLTADLTRLQEHRWSLQRSIADDGTITEAQVDWRCLPLRSIGGSMDRTDPGGPSLEPFADTAWLAAAPYLAEVLAAIPAQQRAARLLALGPGAASWEHTDTKYGPSWGTARLHVPITTYPDARLFMEGTLHQWQPGALWFGDFSRLHRVENTGDQVRVHLVVDTLVSPELLELFPASYSELLEPGEALCNARSRPLDAPARAALPVAFEVPRSFCNWEEDGEFLTDPELAPARIEVDGDRARLVVDDAPLFGLEHVGATEFRFTGWTDERSLQVVGDRADRAVVLRTRHKDTVRELRRHAR